MVVRHSAGVRSNRGGAFVPVGWVMVALQETCIATAGDGKDVLLFSEDNGVTQVACRYL